MHSTVVYAASWDSAVLVTQNAGDLIGTAAFAISGALLAIRRDFDIVGVVTLAAMTACGGGVIRDLIIGRTPPTAFVDLRYLAVAIISALVIFIWSPPPRLMGRPLDLADALGLGAFCVAGTVTAHDHGLGFASSALLGVVTAVGGGVIRDVLGQRTPSVLRPDQEIYAIPALFGAVITAALLEHGRYSLLAGGAVAAAVFTFRVLALRFRWRAPQARGRTTR
ncbi:trimeric intracellular cation channel family protein [Mycobacterium sp. NPDC003323]